MNFLNAFNRRLPPDFEPSLNDPLDLAAGVVVRVMTCQDEAARPTLDQLFAGTDEAVALAIFLRAWLPSSDDRSVINAGLVFVERMDDALLRARLCSKLITSAFAHHWDNELPGLFEAAI